MTARPRVVAVSSLRNEAWIAERWVRRTAEVADRIVAIDDGSTDRTPEILAAHPKVELIRRSGGGAGITRAHRNLLIDRARVLGAEWVLILDADELMDARLPQYLDKLLSDPSVGRIFFREVTLWRGTTHYRVDKPEMYHRDTGTCQLVRLTPGLRWGVAGGHGWKRRVIELATKRRWRPAPVAGHETLIGIEGDTLKADQLVRVHYHFADWDRAWRMHVRYAARDAIMFRRRLDELDAVVAWATRRLDEEGVRLSPVRPEWGVL